MNLYDRKRYLDENVNACSYMGGESVFVVINPHLAESEKTGQNADNGDFSASRESAKTSEKSSLVSKNTEKIY